MERCGAGKDVVHAWDFVGMVGGGEASIGSIFVVPMMEKSVLDTEGVFLREHCFAQYRMDQGSPFVCRRHSNSLVDVASHHNLCVWVDGAENGIK
jgi:hypothetical protein